MRRDPGAPCGGLVSMKGGLKTGAGARLAALGGLSPEALGRAAPLPSTAKLTLAPTPLDILPKKLAGKASTVKLQVGRWPKRVRNAC